jgi:hypothetical protein
MGGRSQASLAPADPARGPSIAQLPFLLEGCQRSTARVGNQHRQRSPFRATAVRAGVARNRHCAALARPRRRHGAVMGYRSAARPNSEIES